MVEREFLIYRSFLHLSVSNQGSGRTSEYGASGGNDGVGRTGRGCIGVGGVCGFGGVGDSVAAAGSCCSLKCVGGIS